MSRLRRFTHSLLSGYVALAANAVFTLATVPLALHYLQKPEFGLWALTAQLIGYVALIDFGISGVSRILIDYKDQKDQGEYGSVIKTLLLVSLVQGVLILGSGVGLAFGLPPALGLPQELRQSFTWLLIGQSVLLALSFGTRLFEYLLTAHQRYDVGNHARSISFIANFAVLWLGFEGGHGVYAMLWGQLAVWLCSTAITLTWCCRLSLFPPKGAWGRPSMKRFVELFAYGRDVFLFFLGGQLVNGSQTILLTRLAGLDTVAVWSVCLRTFSLLQQMGYRVFDFSCAALAEMIVREERERLFQRFKAIVALTCSLSVVGGLLFIVCNQSFVVIWTKGRIGWSEWNNALLGVWLFLCLLVHSHVGLVGQTKEFLFMRYIYFLEGAFFVGVSLLVIPHGGVTAMAAASIAATTLFTLPYGLFRTSRYFDVPIRDIAFGWQGGAGRLAMALVPIAALTWWLTRPLAPAPQLAIRAGVVGVAGLFLLFRVGLDASLRQELMERCPDRLRGGVRWLAGLEAPPRHV